jgi:hypothetical protein
MLKVFYWPIYFRVKKLGETKALVISVLAVFLLTWFFHAYQWFWLRGTFLFTGPDILFWVVLGILVVVNSVWELKHGRERRLSGSKPTAGQRLGIAARTFGTFATMAILWSLWSSQSVGEWFELWSAAGRPVDKASLGFFTGIGMVIAGAVAMGSGRKPSDPAAAAGPGTKRPASGPDKRWLARSTALTAAGLLAIFLLGNPVVTDRVDPTAQRVLRDLRWSRLSQKDQAQLERGYYENLNAVNSFNSQLWELYMRRPVYVPIWETDAVRNTGDYLVNELNPDVSIVFRGAPYRTNRWGMRDRDYEKVPPPATFRLALLGDSITEGWGVGNEENFDHLLETRLNQEGVAGYDHVEIMNFAVGGYLPVQIMMTLERKVFDFSPDAVFFVAHPGDPERVVWHLVGGVLDDVENPYPGLQHFTDEAGITAQMEKADAIKILMPKADSALAVVYELAAASCAKRGITPVWVYLPAVPGEDDRAEKARLTELASRAGFRIFDLSGIYDRADLHEVRIGDWDQHPSRLGHRLIADAFYAKLMEDRATWFAKPKPPGN